jgi:outer membrane protein OmpA-like peptidoglycan-associated protein
MWIRNYLVSHGVSDSQIGFATGWGKLYQLCQQQDEACFERNRRADLIPPNLLPSMSGPNR